MDIRFIVDTQLPPSLAEFFKRRGFDAKHVIDYPQGALTTDEEIIRIAKEELRIIVTKDSDFMNYYFLKGFPPAILLLQLGNIKNSKLFAFLDKLMEPTITCYSNNTARFIIIQEDRIFYF
jgi:predicted nuclease of predicted toxin-antitoxin system